MTAPPAPPPTTIGGVPFRWGERTFLMGVLNATPDSFSGDGLLDPDRAVDRAVAMAAAGADILDLGAESTRPGHAPLDAAQEWARLGPVLAAVRARVALPLSVDTSKAAVWLRARRAGADLLNDVHGLAGDPEMAAALAAGGTPAVLMHNQRGRPPGGDVIAEVAAGFADALARAAAAGVPRERLILDPGFGFGWEVDDNLRMLARLPQLRAATHPPRPLLLGTSRKSTIGSVLDRPVGERLWGTAATVALAVRGGADIVRVHDVPEMAAVVRIADAVVRPAPRPPAPRRVWLALGGNVGDPRAQLTAALAALAAAPEVTVEAVSPLYDTAPWGVADQPRFRNAVCRLRTALPAATLLARLQQLEAAAGRTRHGAANGPRPLDLDLLLVEGETHAAAALTVPHPRLAERAFVVVPLADVDPDLVLPGDGRSVRALAAALAARGGTAGVVRVAGPGWWEETGSEAGS